MITEPKKVREKKNKINNMNLKLNIDLNTALTKKTQKHLENTNIHLKKKTNKIIGWSYVKRMCS